MNRRQGITTAEVAAIRAALPAGVFIRIGNRRKDGFRVARIWKVEKFEDGYSWWGVFSDDERAQVLAAIEAAGVRILLDSPRSMTVAPKVHACSDCHYGLCSR